MFKLNIDKKAIEELINILKKNNLSQIEVKNGNKSIKIAKENTLISNLSSGIENAPNENIKKNTDTSLKKLNEKKSCN